MTDIFLDNPFNCEEICMDIDPIYAVTAEDRDRMACLLYLPEITNLDTYVEARYLFDYRKIITDAVKSSKSNFWYCPSDDLAFMSWAKLKSFVGETYKADPGNFFLGLVRA